MWQSEDDIVKDLASLNDFGDPGDREPYKFLYSIGRGSKIRRKKISDKFVDTRTGEVINVMDLEIPDTLYKSKGRGTLLGYFSKSKLQEQLRLARPLGSGDEAVESYYGRNRSGEKCKTQSNATDFEPKNINRSTAVESPRTDSSTVETRLRVKAVRNSSLQCNALLTNLISKAKTNSNAELIKDNCNGSNRDSNVEFSIDDKSNRFNKFKKQKSLMNGFESQNVYTKSEGNVEKDCWGKICEPSDQSTKKDNVGVEHFGVLFDERKGGEKEQDKKAKSKDNNENKTDDIEKKEEHDEKCIKPGQKPNRLDENYSKVARKPVYDFSKFSQCIASINKESKNEFGIFDNAVSTPFLYNEYDFPPLQRN